MNPEIGPSDIQRFELWLWTIQRALHFKALSLLPASLPIVFSHFSPPCACGSVNVSVCKHRLGVPVASTVYRPRMRTLILGNSQDAIPNAPTQAAQLHCTTIGPCSEPYVVSWKMVRECQRCWKSLKKYIVDINGYIAMVKLWLIIPRHGGPVGSSGDFWCSCCYIEHHRTVSRFLHLRCHRSPEVPDLWRISWSISTSTCGRVGCLSGDFAAERNMILVMFHVPNYWVSQCLHFILISSWFHPDFIAFASTWIIQDYSYDSTIIPPVRICGSVSGNHRTPWRQAQTRRRQVHCPSAMFGIFWRIWGEKLEDLNNTKNLNTVRKGLWTLWTRTRSRHLRHMPLMRRAMLCDAVRCAKVSTFCRVARRVPREKSACAIQGAELPRIFPSADMTGLAMILTCRILLYELYDIYLLYGRIAWHLHGICAFAWTSHG